MKFATLPLLLFFVIFLSINLPKSDCKRSRGRSRGTSSSSGGFWNRKKSQTSQSQTDLYPKQEYVAKPAPNPSNNRPKQEHVAKPAPKPSAPAAEPAIKKDHSNVQQSSNVAGSNAGQPGSNAQKPIGWNVPGSNGNNQNHGFNAAGHQSHVQTSQQSQYSGAYPNTGSSNYYGTGSYGTAAGHQPAQFNPQQGHNGYHPSSNIGGVNQQSHYSNSQSGLGHPPGYMNNNNYNGGGGYNNGGYNNGGYGGGGYGGGGYGAGGYGGGGYGGGGYGGGGYGGGMGGYGGGMMGGMMGGGMMGGMMGGGYGMKKSGGFFGRHAFRNIIGGLLVWHLISGLTKRPYNVYNYYNKPENDQIELPSNILTLCNENATSLCAPGTTAICTTNNTILCVTTMAQTSPCPQENAAQCVSSVIPCIDKNDPLCQNNTKEETTATVNLPCFANLTVDVNLMNFDPSKVNGTSNGTLSVTGNKDFTYCVTTFAVPGPDDPVPCGPNTPPNTPCVNGTTPVDLSNNGNLSMNYGQNQSYPIMGSGVVDLVNNNNTETTTLPQ